MNIRTWKIRGAAVLAAGLLLGATACGGSSASTGGSSAAGGGAATTVAVRHSSSHGATVLVDARGRTLYTLSAERKGRFICTASSMIPGSTTTCTSVWHPLLADGAVTGSGVSSLGTIARPDGGRQVTWRGLPLYTFAQDSQSGQASGNGLRDVGVWRAATVAGSSPAPSTGGGGYGGGYGY